MPTIEEIVGGQASGGNEEVELDFSGAIEFEALKGEFKARCVSATPGTSNTGNPKIVFVFTLLEGPQAGKERKLHGPTTGKGSGKTKQVIKALGGDVSGERIRFRPSSVVGQDAILVLGPQKDDDQWDEIKRVKPISS